MTLYLLSYNNYYDRIIKKEPTLQDYDDYVIYTIPNANFHVADGINTSHIVGGPNIYDGSANYLIVADNGIIHSRWFIIENDKTRGGQYNLTLHRDVVSDYYNIVINAPCFIEKATLDNNNPLIFNQEDMTFNQIKTSEKIIKDGTLCPWIVGYFKRDFLTGAKTITEPIETIQAYTPYSNFDEVPFYSAIQSGYYNTTLQTSIGFEINCFTGRYKRAFYRYRGYTDKTYTANFLGGTADIRDPLPPYAVDNVLLENDVSAATWQSITNIVSNSLLNDTSWYNSVVKANSKTNSLNFLSTWPKSGKVIRVGTVASGYTYYRITRGDAYTVEENFNPATGTTGYAKFKECLENNDLADVKEDSSKNFAYWYKYDRYDIRMEQIPAPESITTTLPANDNRTKLEDSPYDMFAIPYGDTSIRFMINGERYSFTPNKSAALQMANAIATAMGGTEGYLLDLQLLPFCPIPSVTTNGIRGNYISLRELTINKDYALVSTTGSPPSWTTAVLFPQKSDFSITIDTVHFGGDADAAYSLGVNITEPKVQALCDTYRLVSPNYNGQFEFNAAKNGGVEYYEVDCTYKPYSPYIHVCPNFGKLYGKDFNDARGLVCGGDFSLPTITDQWINYEINNKNYLNTFNRQIENMEVNNKYQREREVIGAVTGAVSAGVSGGMTGGMLTGSTGAGVGVGLATAAISGIAAGYDISVNDKLRAEAIDYTKDQFGYQLGNIQALPYSLNRVSAFNINNKVFPIVEYYTCTDIEKQALRDKVKYNGMTVMTIGYIADYIRSEKSYIKGQIIRFDNNDLDDFHIAAAISEEIKKGVFI